jgi:hypothetical protein
MPAATVARAFCAEPEWYHRISRMTIKNPVEFRMSEAGENAERTEQGRKRIMGMMLHAGNCLSKV